MALPVIEVLTDGVANGGDAVVNQSLAASVTAPGLVGPLVTANVGTSRPYTRAIFASSSISGRCVWRRPACSCSPNR